MDGRTVEMSGQLVTFVSGDLFGSKAQTLTNAVNIVGVMGAGIAKEFKKRFPEMFKDYQRKCDANEVVVGKPFVWRPNNPDGKWVLNFPTKKHWRGGSKIEWIEEGLEYLIANYEAWGITSLAMPALGCSLGGLDWKKVKPLMVDRLGRIDIPVEIYAPIASRTRIDSARDSAVTGRTVVKKSSKKFTPRKQLPLL